PIGFILHDIRNMDPRPVILLPDVLRELDSGEPFDMKFVKADRRRGTGGEIVEVRKWVKVQTEERASAYTTMPSGGGKNKRPNHHHHKTLNIMNLRNPKTKRKVHIRLICEFNGKQVL